MWLSVLLYIALFVIALLYYRQYICRLPPGPWGLPLVGYTPFLNTGNPYKSFDALQKKYGGIFSMNILGRTFVVTSDYKITHDLMVHGSCLARPDLEGVKMLYEGKIKGIFNSSGEYWRRQRMFFSQYLKHIWDKGVLERSIMAELSHFMRSLDTSYEEGKPVYPGNLLVQTFINITWKLCFGRRMEKESKLFQFITKDSIKQMEEVNYLFFWGFLPKFMRKFFKLTLVEEILKMRKDLQRTIEVERETFLDGESPENDFFIHYCLRKMESPEKDQDAFGDEDIENTLVDFLAGASETSASTTAFCILYCAYFPEMQQKLYDEIQSILGDQVPSIEDIPKFHYFSSFLTETLRKSSVVPLALARTNSEAIEVNNYFIPKDSILIGNIYSINRSPNHWENGTSFNPERFLNENGQFSGQKEGFMTFSSGRRKCPGNSMAKAEIFLLMVTLLQKYKILLLENYKNVSLEPQSGIVLQTDKFAVELQLRDDTSSSQPLKL